MNPPFSEPLRQLLAIGERAGAFVRTAYEQFTPIPDAPASITTDIDCATQDRIVRELHAAFPGDGFLAEESTAAMSEVPRGGRRVWIVDPIDGTRGFARKNGEFSIMVALTIDCEPVLGIVVEPAWNRTTFAERGTGCFVLTDRQPPRRCTVSAVPSLPDATLAVSHLKPDRPKPIVEALAPARRKETYSAGVKLALVARGEADLYVNDYDTFNDWDIAAGHILVTEAGGTVTLLSGKPLEYLRLESTPRGGVVASNGLLHAAAISRLTAARPAR